MTLLTAGGERKLKSYSYINLNAFVTMSYILPPSVFYSQLLPNAKTKKELDRLLLLVEDYNDFLIELSWMFRYGSRYHSNPRYYTRLQEERMQLKLYIDDIRDARKAF